MLPHGGTSTAAAVGAGGGGYGGGSGPPCAKGVSTVLMDNAKWVGSRSNGLGCGGTPESTNISQFISENKFCCYGMKKFQGGHIPAEMKFPVFSLC